jgi:uncharacterized SAM-binding protein YcdF (DUF218 family)
MDSILFHPKIVHLPIALGVLMPLVAGGLLLAWWRQWLPARAFALAVALQAVLVGSSVAALQSGEAEEEKVERVVSEARIEAHEEAAEAFTWAAGVVLGVMLLGFAASRTKAGLPVALAATVGTVVVFGLGYRTGEAGGELVYRHGAASAYTGSATTPAAARRHHDDD